MKPISLIGYSGHAFVVADILQLTNYKIVGYFEKKIVDFNPFQLSYLGYEQDDDFINKTQNILLFPAIGDNNIRKKVINLLLENNLAFPTLIHPKANVSSYTEIKEGTLICQGVCINPLVKIGYGVIINTGAIVEHECNIGDFSHIAPGAVLAGNISIGQNSFIGANSVIKQGVKVGNNVVVGAGSVVLRDIPDNETWVGNPAKKLRNNVK